MLLAGERIAARKDASTWLAQSTSVDRIGSTPESALADERIAAACPERVEGEGGVDLVDAIESTEETAHSMSIR
jgi:hypothetical protein